MTELKLPLLATVKLVMTLVGVGIFGLGIRLDQAGVRWVGIGLVVMAFVLRFAKRDRPAEPDRDEPTRA